MIKRLLLTVLLLVVGGCAGPGSGAPSGSMPQPGSTLGLEVSVAQAAELRGEAAFVLDVREPSEWAAGHIAGATLIPLDQLPTRMSEVPRYLNVVVVCRTGHRSAEGRDILLAAGYRTVTSMTGGMTEWIAEGNPIVTGD